VNRFVHCDSSQPVLDGINFHWLGKAQLDKLIARASHQAETLGVPLSIIDSEFLERLR